MTITFDHFFDSGDAMGIAEAAIIFAEATLDDPISSEAERDDSRKLINLGVAELARRLALAGHGPESGPKFETSALLDAPVHHDVPPTDRLLLDEEPPTLTAREFEIASLVAGGNSNQQISEKLSVSVRTVEGHIYRACTKLGVVDRASLGATIRSAVSRWSDPPTLI